MALFEEQKARSIAELMTALDVITGGATKTRWYRGQRRHDWKLTPSIARGAYSLEREVALIKRFKQNAHAVMNRQNAPRDEWEWLFLMQHHGAPTRLLDWSENPLVALFFATEKKDEPEVDGRVWCLDPVELNKAAYVQSEVQGEFPFFGVDKDLETYLTESIQNTKTPKPPVAALAPRFFARLAAQAGVFTITHKEQTPLETTSDGRCVGHITIPADAKERLRKDLTTLGITRLLLFPELEAVATNAKEIVL